MNRELWGIVASYAFVFLFIILSTFIQKKYKLSPEFSRKIIHISVGNWVFFAFHFFEHWYIAGLVPASFIIINYLSYRYQIFKAMELEEKNPGTVYYSISLTVLTILTFIRPTFYMLPYLGIMAMTWGDGMAAVIGKNWALKSIRKSRSLGGSSAFFVFTAISSGIYLIVLDFQAQAAFIVGIVFVTAIIGTVVELFSPHNKDNLTVPLIIGILGFILERYML